jgi:hypothetical protein
MKLDDRTVVILKNFSTINQSLLFKKGSELLTRSTGHSVLAIANVKEKFPIDFGIYDLSRFLSVLSLFELPDLEFEEKHLVIKNGKHSVKYIYHSSEMIDAPFDPHTGDKIVPKTKEFEVEFGLTKDNFSALMKAAAVMQLPEFVVIGDGKSIRLAVMSTENPTGDEYVIKLESGAKNKFRMVFPIENMLLLNEPYDVKISSKGIGKFIGDDVQYWIPCNPKNSVFEG